MYFVENDYFLKLRAYFNMLVIHALHIYNLKYSCSPSHIVFLSPFVPSTANCSEQLYLNLNFLEICSYQIRSGKKMSPTSLCDISHLVTTGDAYRQPCAVLHVIEGELNSNSYIFCSRFGPKRRSYITLRPRWRSTAITRSSWSCPTRNCDTWRLQETKSTSRGTRKSTTHWQRKLERLATR